MQIRFDIDADTLTVGDMLMIEDMQEGKNVFHSMTGLLSRYMVNEDGTPMGEAAAMVILRGLKLPDFQAAGKAFGEAIQRKAIPPLKSASL